METCKSGSEGGSVKPDVAIHEGARFLPYKGTWLVRDFPHVLTQTECHRRTGETYVIWVCMQNVETPSFSRHRGS
jgi:hypothetical protein